MAIVREVEYEVGYESASVVSLRLLARLVAQRLLRVKLLALLQLEVFEQLLQLQLAEVALHLHLSGERTCQPVGSLAQRRALLHVHLYRGIETRERFVLLFLRFVERLAHALQALCERVDYLRHLLLVALAQLVLTSLQNLLRRGLHLFAYELHLTLHLLAVHLSECFYLLLLTLLHLLELRRLRRLQLFELCRLRLFQFSNLLLVRLFQFGDLLVVHILKVCYSLAVRIRHHADDDGCHYCYYDAFYHYYIII